MTEWVVSSDSCGIQEVLGWRFDGERVIVRGR
ncbi:hypothetical protein J2W18_004379 [Rhodococcus cercidiphylli]|nr:hypothetical protein [Rhodococcus cercidiphylli]